MKAKRSVGAITTLVLLCIALLVMPAQAQDNRFICERLLTIGIDFLWEEERIWYSANCVEREDDEDEEPEEYRPPDVTCPHLPARVAVFGYAVNTQCQMIDAAGIGQMDVMRRGFIDAVDVWSYVNGGVEVCFRNDGWLVFLDAGYSPRMAMELEHTHRAGMTCGVIDRAGTVALLRDGPPATDAPAATEDSSATDASPATEAPLPVFESIPLSDCQIKLLETLYLRAEPGGEIIGLVWLNAEVPVFEINGYWYKVEFEGQAGYISRYYRRVLRGGCG